MYKYMSISLVIVGIFLCSGITQAVDISSFRYSVVDQEELSELDSMSRFDFEFYQESVMIQSVTSTEILYEINILIPDLTDNTDIEVSATNLFNYPNPFRLKSGTLIGYTLSKDMAVQLLVYNVFGHKIYEKDFNEGVNGGKGAPFYNKIEFNDDIVGGGTLSSGVYFFILVHESDVIGKGKMAIIP
jgi:hypothetical protein